MHLRLDLALALTAALAMSVTACGGDDEDNNSGGTGGGTAGSGGTGGAAGTGGGTAGTGGGTAGTGGGTAGTAGTGGGTAGAAGAGGVTLGATFLDYGSKAPIEGLQVCTLIPNDRDPGCADTIAGGIIRADGFPINSEVLFKLTKDTYVPILIPAVTTDKDDTDSTLFPVTESTLDLLLATASITLESGKGAISFIADQSEPGTTAEADGQPDVSVSVSPDGGTMAYLNGILLSTTATATAESGLGLIVNLDPGDYTLTFTHGTKTCTTRLGWSTADAKTSKVPVQADTVTYVLHQCGG